MPFLRFGHLWSVRLEKLGSGLRNVFEFWSLIVTFRYWSSSKWTRVQGSVILRFGSWAWITFRPWKQSFGSNELGLICFPFAWQVARHARLFGKNGAATCSHLNFNYDPRILSVPLLFKYLGRCFALLLFAVGFLLSTFLCFFVPCNRLALKMWAGKQ